MTVHELIMELRAYPGSQEVMIDDDIHLMGLRDVDGVSTRTWTTGRALPKPKTHPVVVLG